MKKLFATIIITLLVFLLRIEIISAQQIKFGNYYQLKTRADKEEISLFKNAQFIREYYTIEMCWGKVRKTINGVWMQNTDTLILIDTLRFSARHKPLLKKIFDVDDSIIIRTTKYRLYKHNKLKYVSCRTGNVSEHWPLTTLKLALQ